MKYTDNTFLMGTDIQITVNSQLDAMDDIYSCFGMLYSLEKEFSKNDEKTGLYKLNNAKTLRLRDRLIKILKLSKQVYFDTNKYFNPLINSKYIGDNENSEKVENEIDNDFDFESIEMTGKYIYLDKNQELDFTGILKGYGVDLVKDYLIQKRYKSFIINVGGNIYCYGKNENGESWEIPIKNIFDSSNIIANLKLENKSISISDTTKINKEVKNDENYILSPKTQINISEKFTIFIVNVDCYIGESYITACFNMGVEKAIKFLEEKNVIGAIVSGDGEFLYKKYVDELK